MTSRVVDAVDELTHVRGEMILGRNFGSCGNGRFSNERQQVSLGFGERVSVRGRRQLANEFRQTRFLDGVDQFHSSRVRFGERFHVWIFIRT